MATRIPWWKATKTAREGFVIGAIWVFLGVGELVLFLVGEVNGYVAHEWLLLRVGYLLFGLVWLLLGIVYLASAFTLRRRERSADSPDQAPDPGGGR